MSFQQKKRAMTPKGQMSGNGSGPAIMMMIPRIRATFMPNPPAADGGVALAALATQTVSVALAFALLTLGAKEVPSAEVSLIMLIELALGPALVWAAVGEVPTWRVWLGSAGVLVTMAVESAVGVADERRKASVPSPASETGGDAAA